jgi:uracil-DNA glycosylase family 4
VTVNPRRQIRECRACGLWLKGQGPVPFRGDPSDIMIVGEAPGRTEDEAGQPFVGPAGKLLWDTLVRYGVAEDDVFVANAVCCWPGPQKKPSTLEITCCHTNLKDQINWCEPVWILALGAVANRALGRTEPISHLHGKAWLLHPAFGIGFRVRVFSLFHPAFILRNQTYKRAWREGVEKFVGKVNRI